MQGVHPRCYVVTHLLCAFIASDAHLIILLSQNHIFIVGINSIGGTTNMSKSIDLGRYGITGVKDIVYNPTYDQLFEEETHDDLEGYEGTARSPAH